MSIGKRDQFLRGVVSPIWTRVERRKSRAVNRMRIGKRDQFLRGVAELVNKSETPAHTSLL